MMSNFLFGVAFDRLLFNALNRYLLKNSSSIETEMRSLILPLESALNYISLEYLSLYLEADTASSFSKLWKPAAISGTLNIPCSPPRIPQGQLTGTLGNRIRVTTSILGHIPQTIHEK